MSCYLDTQIVVWLCAGQLDKISPRAGSAIEDSELLISPMVLLELDYLHELRRLIRPPQALVHQLRTQIGLRVCEHPFSAIVETALLESWTRDPFDRVIVAHARSNAYSTLVTSDEKIRQNYTGAVW